MNNGHDIFEAYQTWPEDIKAKLSVHDLRRMNGWAPRTNVGDWRIDTSAGGPILVYKDCSVIEGEDARYVLSLIRKDQRPVCTTQDGKDWNGNPIIEDCTTILSARIAFEVELCGSLQRVAKELGIDVGYLSRLARGEKTNPSDEVLKKLGLERTVTYTPIKREYVASPLHPRTNSA